MVGGLDHLPLSPSFVNDYYTWLVFDRGNIIITVQCINLQCNLDTMCRIDTPTE